MSDLIVVAFDDELKAEKIRLSLMEMKKQDMIDLEEAAIMVRSRDGKVRLHHVAHWTGPATLGGGFVGILAGLMLFNPVLAAVGMVGGAAVGAAVGAMSEVGIEEDFMKRLAACVRPGSSAIFILSRSTDPESLKRELEKFDGKLLHTRLEHTETARLRKVLAEVERIACPI